MNLTMYNANDPTFILGPSNYLMEIDRQKRTIQKELVRKDVKRSNTSMCPPLTSHLN